ncbi:MAG: hypothetical protein RIF41_06475 [Polyangiaceae bacterium]
MRITLFAVLVSLALGAFLFVSIPGGQALEDGPDSQEIVENEAGREVAEHALERAEALTDNPLLALATYDLGLSKEVDKLERLSREADADTNLGVINTAFDVDNFVEIRASKLRIVVPVMTLGWLIGCLGIYLGTSSQPSGGRQRGRIVMLVLFGCAAPILSGQIAALALSIPLLVLGVVAVFKPA